MPAEISIIIPTLNEANELGTTLQSIHDNSLAPLEIIVVDAGSSDETLKMAEAANCHVLSEARRGRAWQMNWGAQASRGDMLVFLHADTHLPRGGLRELQQTMERRPQVVGGGFSRRYRTSSLFLRGTCCLADWRGSCFGLFLGDQVQFVRRCLFERLGGFKEWAAFEDLDLSRRMRQAGPTIRLTSRVLSSARRFQGRGPLRTTLRDFKATWQFLRGADVEDILKWLKQ